MTQWLKFPVESLLTQQIELIGPAAVSLDSLWRAAGCPSERSPRKWLQVAAPLVAGFARYLENVPDNAAADIATPEGQLVWVWEGEDGEPWRSGDVMTHELLARVYALYLDPMD